MHHIYSKWHQIVFSIVAMYEQLVQLGITFYNGEIHMIEPTEKQKYV